MQANRISPSDFLIFNRQLVSLIKTDLPLPNGLAMLSKESRQPAMRNAVAGLQRAVEAGEPLSKAVANRPDVFPKLYAKIIEAGERSNNLVGVLAQFVKYSETTAELKERLKDVLMYPAFVLVSALAVFSLLVFFILPTAGQTILTITLGDNPDSMGYIRASLGVRLLHFLVLYLPTGTACLYGLIVLAVLVYLVMRRTNAGRVLLDRIMLRLPLYGQCYRFSLLSRFSETLGLLIQSHLPLGDALYLAGQCSPSATMHRVAARLQHGVEAGRKLSDAMAAEPFLGPMLAYMVSIGEKREAPDEELQSAAELFAFNLRGRARRAAVWIDTIVLVLVALLVLAVVISVYRPLFTLIQVMGEG
ncbi:MAG: type II secretion system F family protein [Verrucomicrobia bacterium]|nr:type II secretion system F family protein [Verrucomicrobiota bacterium]